MGILMPSELDIIIITLTFLYWFKIKTNNTKNFYNTENTEAEIFEGIYFCGYWCHKVEHTISRVILICYELILLSPWNKQLFKLRAKSATNSTEQSFQDPTRCEHLKICIQVHYFFYPFTPIPVQLTNNHNSFGFVRNEVKPYSLSKPADEFSVRVT